MVSICRDFVVNPVRDLRDVTCAQCAHIVHRDFTNLTLTPYCYTVVNIKIDLITFFIVYVPIHTNLF